MAAYKVKSPIPVAEGGTNATSMTTTDGVVYYDGTSLVTTAVGSATNVLTSNGAGMAPTFQPAGGGGGGTIVTTYNRADTGSTWTKNASTKYVQLYIYDAGGGGGSGALQLDTASGGGGGGSAGAVSFWEGPASYFPATALITVASGGIGGASQTTLLSDGNSGDWGGPPFGQSSFGQLKCSNNSALLGQGGTNGNTNSQPSGIYSTFQLSDQSSPSTAGAGHNGDGDGVVYIGFGTPTIFPTAAAGGGGANSTISTNGGNGGDIRIPSGTPYLFGGTPGSEAGGFINGGNGNNAAGGGFGGVLCGGTGGGGGGGYSTGALGNTTGGNGGNGGIPGGGGGGGGGGISGVSTGSGAGGNGGDGQIIVIEYT